jgi:hypothetical protein
LLRVLSAWSSLALPPMGAYFLGFDIFS